MKISLSHEVIRSSGIERLINLLSKYHTEDVLIDNVKLSPEDRQRLLEAARSEGDKAAEKAIDFIIRSQDGSPDIKVPNFKAFDSALTIKLNHNKINGWIFVDGGDDKFYPYAIDSVDHVNATKHSPEYVSMKLIATGIKSGNNSNDDSGTSTHSITFYPKDVSGRTVTTILEAKGCLLETHERIAAYGEDIQRFNTEIRSGFSRQFSFTGKPCQVAQYRRQAGSYVKAKVIHDVMESEYAPQAISVDSELFDHEEVPLPYHPVVKVFDLRQHEHFWVHANHLTPYVYDKDLGNKIVLPESHRDLLDILTSDYDVFLSDFVEGKSAGNLILCQGPPGLGKTLTAEIYGELTERPLYNVHTGVLGTEPKEIHKNLQKVIANAERWGCVTLLDEADVFVMQRNDDIRRNAIVAEFLRTLEYSKSLIFATTNRGDDIDDAIISRCVAIIKYEAPVGADLKKVWGVFFDHFKVNGQDAATNESLIDTLCAMFDDISPRDIKMLTSLVMRIATKTKKAADAEMFRKAALFRAIKFKKGSADAA